MSEIGLSRYASSTHQAGDEHQEKDAQEDVEENLSDRCSGAGQSPESEDRSDDRNDEKYECPSEHDFPRLQEWCDTSDSPLALRGRSVEHL
jgi:hypothetical protein